MLARKHLHVIVMTISKNTGHMELYYLYTLCICKAYKNIQEHTKAYKSIQEHTEAYKILSLRPSYNHCQHTPVFYVVIGTASLEGLFTARSAYLDLLYLDICSVLFLLLWVPFHLFQESHAAFHIVIFEKCILGFSYL